MTDANEKPVELKPCPFCGGEARDRSYRSCDCCGKDWNYNIGCSKCTAEVSHLDTNDDAIAAWNTRPADEARDAWRPIETCSTEQSQAGCIVAADGAVGEARWHGHDEGWYWAGNDPTDVWGWRIEPTHWQPLPPPPMQKEPGRE